MLGVFGHGGGAGGARAEKTVIGYVKQRRKSVPVGAREGSLDFNFEKMKINENEEGRLRGKRMDTRVHCRG